MSQELIQAVASITRDLRKRKEMTQEELAEAAGMDRTYVSGIERGVRNITLESLELLIRALGISPEQFLDCLKKKLIANRGG